MTELEKFKAVLGASEGAWVLPGWDVKRVLAALAQPAIAPAEPDVGHSALAGMILTHLGYSTSPSLEPCADERRDRLAEKLAGWLSASPQAPQPVQAVPMKGTLNLNDPSVQKRLAAQWGYVQAPAHAPDERDRLRAAQDAAVMPLIGPLLDAWEQADREVMDDEPELVKWLKAINTAMETAGEDQL